MSRWERFYWRAFFVTLILLLLASTFVYVDH